MDAAFADTVRDLLGVLAAGGEPVVPVGGGLARAFREASPAGPRAAVEVLAERWFRASSPTDRSAAAVPILNRPDVGESEKQQAILVEHVGASRRWQDLSSNESTFYRYRRAAFAAFAERLWLEITERPLATNRPRPDYARFIGRQDALGTLLRRLTEAGGSVVGVEGPGGSGKTALLHAVADACEQAARSWQPVFSADGTPVPLFDAIIWVSRSSGADLSLLLDAVARTLDYPGLLAQALLDRRQAVLDLLARRAALVIVDDVDRADLSVAAFLGELPSTTRALVAARRRLPAETRALMPRPFTGDEVRALLLAEAERQGTPDIAQLLLDSGAGDPFLAPAHYPLLAGWAVGQLRRGQTVERVRERLARAEGEVFAEMFSASISGLSPAARALLSVLPLLPGFVDRATLLAAGGEAALDDLLETSLLEILGPPTDAARRYGLHAVTRSFVESNLPPDPAQARMAIARLAGHYAGLATEWGGSALKWHQFDRLEAELPNILAVVEAAAREARQVDGDPPGPAFDRALLRLAYELRNVFAFGRAWAEGLALFHRAIEAARRAGDQRAEGWNTYRIGALHYELGTGGYAEAARRAREAAGLLQTAGDPRGRGHALRLLGRATRERGKLREAERLLEEAEALLLVHGRRDDVAIVKASQADLLRVAGRLDRAAALYDEALATGLNDPGTEANIRHDLAEIALLQGKPAEADEGFGAAERLADAAGARAIVARSRFGQAQVARALGDAHRAARLAASAVDLFERLGDSEQAHEARALLATIPIFPSDTGRTGDVLERVGEPTTA